MQGSRIEAPATTVILASTHAVKGIASGTESPAHRSLERWCSLQEATKVLAADITGV